MITIPINEILNDSLNVLIKQFIKENNFLLETRSYVMSDDGPGTWIDYNNYKKYSATATEKIGYEILSYMIDKEDYDKSDYREYPNGPVNAVSFGPAGMPNKLTTVNQIDATSEEAYKLWKQHISNITNTLGWTFLNWYDPSVFEDKF